jgi:hypothetical protein
LKPDWLSDAVYLGTYDYADTTEAYLWNKGDNFYWETIDPTPTNRVTIEIDDGVANKWAFSQPRTTNVDHNIFNVPTYCQSNLLCDSNSLCAQVRGSGGKSEHLKHLEFN